MSAPAMRLVIDARPRGPHGPLAVEPILGRPVLDHLLDQAIALQPAGEVLAVHTRADEIPLLRPLVELHDRRIALRTGPPVEGAAVLRTDRLYDFGRLRRAIRRGRNLETAVLWKLDRPGALAAAGDELTRRRTYQPLGRFWAFPVAERVAAALEPTRVHPNWLTLGAAGAMLAAAATVGFAGSGWLARGATAMALAIGLVLDTADGRLARLQGTGSAFGRWLDHVFDELCDLVLHVAIAWSCYQASGAVWWLLLGMLYVSGKQLFLVQSVAGGELERELAESPPGVEGVAGQQTGPTVGRRRGTPLPARRLRLVRSLVALAGHADLRWHLWIALALANRLDLALIVYAVYFPIRALAGGLRKVVEHG